MCIRPRRTSPQAGAGAASRPRRSPLARSGAFIEPWFEPLSNPQPGVIRFLFMPSATSMGSPNHSSLMITTPTASPHTPIVEDIATINQPLLTAATRLLAFATLLKLASHACQS